VQRPSVAALLRSLPELQPPLLQPSLAILDATIVLVSSSSSPACPAFGLTGLLWTLTFRQSVGPTYRLGGLIFLAGQSGGQIAQIASERLGGLETCAGGAHVNQPCVCALCPLVCARRMDPHLGVSPWHVRCRFFSACAHPTRTLHAVGGVDFCCRLEEIHPEGGAFAAQNGSLDYNAAPMLEYAASLHTVKLDQEQCHGAVPAKATSGQSESVLSPAPEAQAAGSVSLLEDLQLLVVSFEPGLFPPHLLQ